LKSTAASAFCLEEGGLALDINIASAHENSTYGNNIKYNENNFGLGLSYGHSDNVDIKIGFYNNSYNTTTTYMATTWQKNYHFKNLTISPGIGAFIVTGYDSAPEFAEKYQPGVIPTVTFAYHKIALNVGLVPSIKSNNVVTFQLQIGF
jgi:hypothetical protein